MVLAAAQDVGPMHLEHDRQTGAVAQVNRRPAVGVRPGSEDQVGMELGHGSLERRSQRPAKAVTVPAAQEPRWIEKPRMVHDHTVAAHPARGAEGRGASTTRPQLVHPANGREHMDRMPRRHRTQLLAVESPSVGIKRIGIQVGHRQDAHR